MKCSDTVCELCKGQHGIFVIILSQSPSAKEWERQNERKRIEDVVVKKKAHGEGVHYVSISGQFLA